MSISRAVSEIVSEDKVGRLVVNSMCNLLQDLLLELWPKKDSEELKYEVIDCERSPMIGTVSAEESKGESEQAGPSSQENSLGDRLKFQGIYHRDERHDCKDRTFGQYEKVTLRQRSKAQQKRYTTAQAPPTTKSTSPAWPPLSTRATSSSSGRRCSS